MIYLFIGLNLTLRKHLKLPDWKLFTRKSLLKKSHTIWFSLKFCSKYGFYAMSNQTYHLLIIQLNSRDLISLGHRVARHPVRYNILKIPKGGWQSKWKIHTWETHKHTQVIGPSLITFLHRANIKIGRITKTYLHWYTIENMIDSRVIERGKNILQEGWTKVNIIDRTFRELRHPREAREVIRHSSASNLILDIHSRDHCLLKLKTALVWTPNQVVLHLPLSSQDNIPTAIHRHDNRHQDTHTIASLPLKTLVGVEVIIKNHHLDLRIAENTKVSTQMVDMQMSGTVMEEGIRDSSSIISRKVIGLIICNIKAVDTILKLHQGETPSLNMIVI